MYKYILNTLLLLGCTFSGFSQVPASWNVNGASYSYSMTLTTKIEYDCDLLNSNLNAVAAFVGNTCRGYAYTSTDAAGVKIANVVIYSNQVSGEAVTLKFYDNVSNQVLSCLDGFTFVNEAIIGSIANPFIATTNHRPTNISVSNLNVQEATLPGGFIGNVTGTDQDSFQTLAFTLAAGNYNNDDFTVSNGQLLLNTVLNFAIQDSFQIELTVNDGQGCDYSELFWVTVDDNAFAPVANEDVYTCLEDDTTNFNLIVNDTDYDNDIDSTSITMIQNPVNGQVVINDNGTIDYIPNANYFGSDSLIYKVCDLTNTGALCDTAWLIISIANVPDAPVANADTISTLEEQLVAIAVLNNDTDIENDINAASLTLIDAPNYGTTTLVAGQIQYTPNLNYAGLDTLIYEICDQSLPTPLCDTAIVYINVIQTPDTPLSLLLDSNTVIEDNDPYTKIGNFSTIDDDVNDTFEYTLVAGIKDGDNAQFEIINDELFIKTRTNFDIKTVYNIRVRTTDSYGLFIEDTFQIKVIDIVGNDLPLPVNNYVSNNNDGKNDVFAIENVVIYFEFTLKVFDQFGQVVFKKEGNYNNEFDGTLNGEKLPSGAYYYIFERADKKYKGNLSIVN